MSYFPPPPPPPVRPSTQAFSPTNFTPGYAGFRGRGNAGHRAAGRGAHGRDSSHGRGRGGYGRGVINHGVHFDRGGYGPNSFNHYGQTQQHPPSYMAQAPYAQGQLENPVQQATWNVGPAVAAGPSPLQLAPIRIGFGPQSDGMKAEMYPQSPKFQPTSHSGGFLNGVPFNGMNGQPQSLHDSQPTMAGSRGRGQKRGYGEAFGQRGGKRGYFSQQTAPVVPSFGGSLSLPSKPPVSESREKRIKKEGRHSNKLGLTPKTEDNGSIYESDDDENEEIKLAANGTNELGQSQALQIQYRGRTSTLNSAADIAAWIEERKKRYPTKARAVEMAERTRQIQEIRRAAKQAQQESRQKAVADAKEKRAQQNGSCKEKKMNKKSASSTEGKIDSEDATAKAKRRLEDLRRRLEKEERRIARAEAKIAEGAQNAKGGTQVPEAEQTIKCNKRKRSPSPPGTEYQLSQSLPHDAGTPSPNEVLPLQDTSPPSVAAPPTLTNPSQPRNPDDAQDSIDHPDEVNRTLNKRPQTPTNLEKHLKSGSSTPSSKLSLTITSDDETSSSGSSSPLSSSDSDTDSDDDAPPSETTAKRERPEKVPPPPREQSKQICKFFSANRGKCRFGNKCRFRHELPVRRGKKDNPARGERQTAAAGGRKGRVGLYQRLVEQEKRGEEEAKRKAEEQGGLDEGLREDVDGGLASLANY